MKLISFKNPSVFIVLICLPWQKFDQLQYDTGLAGAGTQYVTLADPALTHRHMQIHLQKVFQLELTEKFFRYEKLEVAAVNDGSNKVIITCSSHWGWAISGVDSGDVHGMSTFTSARGHFLMQWWKSASKFGVHEVYLALCCNKSSCWYCFYPGLVAARMTIFYLFMFYVFWRKRRHKCCFSTNQNQQEVGWAGKNLAQVKPGWAICLQLKKKFSVTTTDNSIT